ncbi:MAG: MFS transporter [Desulfobacterales bacterium]|nr:MFS transporter [Desulfobacterales bacterium]
MNRSSSGILFVLCISVGVSMTGLGIVWPLVPVYAVELGAGGFLVGIIIAGFNVSKTIFSPFSGWLSDRWGRKNFIVTGLAAYGVISVFYLFPSRAETLVLIRFFHGMASVLVVPIAMALTADIAPPLRLGKYMGTLNMAIMLGLGIGPVLGGTIRDRFGMEAAFYTMGGLAFLTCIIAMFMIPPDQSRHTTEKKKEVQPMGEVIRHPVMMGIFLMRFFAASGQGAVYTFIPILAVEMGISSSRVGVLLGANIFLIAFLQRASGSLADRMNPKHLVIWGTFASGLTVLGMPFVDGFAYILLLNVLMGVANGLALPGGLVMTGHLGKKLGMASVMSINDASWSLGMIVSPVLSGIILDLFGLAHVFVIGSLLILLGTCIAGFFFKSYRPSS